MSTEIELFRTDDYVRTAPVPLGPLLRNFFEPLVGQSIAHSRFELLFLPIADPRVLAGNPSVINLRADYGYVRVRIHRDGKLLYQHPHSVREIVGMPLQRMLIEEHPDETHWGFGIKAPGLDQVALVRPAPQGDSQVNLTVGPGRPRRFHVEEVAGPEPPVATLAELGVDDHMNDPGDRVGVVLDHDAFDALIRRMPFSDEVEEGGFLTGRVYRVADRPGSLLVAVDAVVPAERTGASMLHFTFTGESFLRMGDRLASRGGEQLVGWYHTHLFAATKSLGLSSIDVELHTTTFRQPWQIAGLINLDGDSRVLRCYHAEGAAMVPAPYWVVGG